MTRRDRLLSMIDLTGLGLEIGPGFNPLLPKSEGYRVETLDHASQEDLRRKYQDAKVDLSRIEAVDYVSDGTSVLQAVGAPGRFRFIVASHVIEHTTDMLGFLRDCEALLEPGGVLALAIPDKRFSFDVLRPLSSTGDVIQAHLEGRTSHPPGRVFDEVAYSAVREGALSWIAADARPLTFFHPFERARELLDHVCRTSDFIDIHAWQFTPSSFRLIVEDLHQAQFLGLRERQFAGDCGAEFMVALSNSGAGPDADRLTLAQRVLSEQAAANG